jgi:hypothetical protein
MAISYRKKKSSEFSSAPPSIAFPCGAKAFGGDLQIFRFLIRFEIQISFFFEGR